jgi:hypothetical protein
VLYRVHLAWAGFELTTLVVIDSDCICSCKSNYPWYDDTITTTTAPWQGFFFLQHRVMARIFLHKSDLFIMITYDYLCLCTFVQ